MLQARESRQGHSGNTLSEQPAHDEQQLVSDCVVAQCHRSEKRADQQVRYPAVEECNRLVAHQVDPEAEEVTEVSGGDGDTRPPATRHPQGDCARQGRSQALTH